MVIFYINTAACLPIFPHAEKKHGKEDLKIKLEHPIMSVYFLGIEKCRNVVFGKGNFCLGHKSEKWIINVRHFIIHLLPSFTNMNDEK